MSSGTPRATGASAYALDESVAETYHWHTVPAIFAPFARQLVEVADLHAGERVLDVGYGTGVVARFMRPRVASSGRVAGLDANGAVLEVARSLAAGGNSDWQRGDATAMPFPDADFDVVLCQHGLQYFADRRAAPGEMHRVLQPFGRLIARVWRPLSFHVGHAVLADVLERQVGAKAAATRRAPFAFSDRESPRDYLADVGFVDVAVSLVGGVARFASAEAMLRAMMASTPLAAAMADAGPAVLGIVIAEVKVALSDHEDARGLAIAVQAWVAAARLRRKAPVCRPPRSHPSSAGGS